MAVVEKARVRRARRTRRAAAIAAVGITPIIALAWAGCSDDEPGNLAGPAYVDPGGTHGAELTITVKGRGRVTTNLPGVDCPSDCFAKYVFASATADGAASKIALKAAPTPGTRFKGWSFSTDPVGSRGRGPANCNPVLRPGSDPGVDKSALEIELPYGETTGTPPAGQEGACSNYTKVPVVYNVTATFETDPPADLDGGEDGGDGGLSEVVYAPPMTGVVGRDVGMTQLGYLYWHFSYGGLSGIAYGSNPAGIAPQPPTVIVNPTTSFTLFEVDPYGVVYQTSSGTIGVIRYGFTSPTTMGGSPPTCTALAVDSSFNVYCRTASTIVRWLYPSYSTPTVLYSGLPSGNDLLVESSFGSLYFTSSSAILSLPIDGADGSVATPTTVVSGRIGPTNLESNGSRFFWLESGGYVYASSSKSVSTSAYDTSVPPTATMKHLAQDVNDSTYFWAASSTAIYHAYYFGGTGPGGTETFRTGLSGIAGMTADGTYVYTSHADGTIRRASRSVF